MSACLSELGAKRDKLRKVGLPRTRTQDELRRTSGAGSSTNGELKEVLSRAFQRKFARANGAPSPATPRVASGSSLRLPTAPEWSPLPLAPPRAEASGLSASQSVPGDLSALARSRAPLRHLPAAQPSSNCAQLPPPRTSSLAAPGVCTETTVFGLALSTDEPRVVPSRPAPLAPVTAGMSPSLGHSSLPSAPPEPLSPPEPAAPAETAPWARAGRSSPRDKLPGLGIGRSRPVTPARRRAQQQQQQRERESAEKAHALDAEDRTEHEDAGDGVVRVDFGSDDDVECEGMEELVGCGERRADPARVFGRA